MGRLERQLSFTLPVSPIVEILEKLEQFQLLIPHIDNKEICIIHRLIQDAIIKRSDYKLHIENAKKMIAHITPAAVEYTKIYPGYGREMFRLEQFLHRKIRVVLAGSTKFAISFPMYKIEGGLYEIYLVEEEGRFYISDEGTTYAELDKIFELKEPDIFKNLVAILKQFGCSKHNDSNAFIIECTPQDIHLKISFLIQAISFMLNIKIFFI